MEIPYLDILKRSWEITRKNKHLWWFGFLASLSGGSNWINFRSDGNSANQKMLEPVLSFIKDNTGVFIALASLAILAFVLLLILGLISRGALIKSLDIGMAGKKVTFKKGFILGRKYLSRIFLIGLTTAIGTIISLAILLIPPVFLFLNHSWKAGVFMSVLAVLILIPIFALLFFAKTYGYLYAVLGKLKFVPALRAASDLFQRNIKESIIMALILLAANFILLSLFILAVLIVGIVFAILGALLYLLFSQTGVIIAVVLGIISLIAIIMIVLSAYETFVQSVWIIFFKTIATPKVEEAIEEPAVKPVVTPTPESIKTTGCGQK